MTGGELQIALFDQDGPTIAPRGIVFESPRCIDGRFLSVSPRGEIAFFLTPILSRAFADDILAPLPTPQDAPSAAENATTAPIPHPGDTEPSEGPAAVSSPLPTDQPEPSERGYLPRLTGRLARNPRFHTTKTGKAVAEFNLGVKDVDDPTKTTWYAICVFGERAEKLKDAIKQGDLVDVIGSYKHVKEFTGRDGQRRRKEQYYATLVKLR